MLTTSYVDHGHVVKQFSENNEIRISLVAHFKRSCGTSAFDWLSVVWALQGERDFLIVLPGLRISFSDSLTLVKKSHGGT